MLQPVRSAVPHAAWTYVARAPNLLRMANVQADVEWTESDLAAGHGSHVL